MNCSRCSAPIPEGGAFCPQCGEKIVVNIPRPVSPQPPPPSHAYQAPVPPPSEPPVTQPAPSQPLPPQPAIRKSVLRREKRREKRRRAKGFWYNPLTNIIILVLCVAGWFFIPREIDAYVTGFDLSNLMAQSAQLFRYSSLRDGWDAAKDAILAILLTVILIILTLMGLAAAYRMIKRMAVVSRRKKEWKKEKKELLRKELSEEPHSSAK